MSKLDNTLFAFSAFSLIGKLLKTLDCAWERYRVSFVSRTRNGRVYSERCSMKTDLVEKEGLFKHVWQYFQFLCGITSLKCSVRATHIENETLQAFFLVVVSRHHSPVKRSLLTKSPEH